MATPTPVVTGQEWNGVREALLVKEKELMRARDALAAERRRLPMVHVDKEYRFEGPSGEEWQDAPEGVPQDRTGSWVRRSDEYTTDELTGGRS